MPATFEAVEIILFFLVPGFIMHKVQGYFCATDEPSDFEYVLKTATFSTLNYIILSPVIILILKDRNYWAEHYLIGFPLLTVPVLITPTLFGILWGILVRRNAFWNSLNKLMEMKWIRHLLKDKMSFIRDGAEVWDTVFDRPEQSWVKLTLTDGKIYQGKTTQISAFPLERALFLTEVVELDKEGKELNDFRKWEGLYIRDENIQTIQIW